MLLIYLESTFHIFTLLLILIFGGVRDSWPEEYDAMNFTYPFIKSIYFMNLLFFLQKKVEVDSKIE
jgi:small basic protein